MLHSLLILALLQGDSPRASLLRADSAYRSAVDKTGLATATVGVLADRAVIVYGGAPVVEGRAVASRLLRAQPVLDSLSITWAPSEVWSSRAGDFGVVYGRTVTRPRFGTKAPTNGLIIAAWERDGEWRLVGLMMIGIASPTETRLAREIGALAHPPVSARGALADMVSADSAFARLAQRTSAADAFRTFAAPDAIILGAAEVLRGPDAIGASFARGPKAKWSWHPVAVRGSSAGDLGFTVGEAIIIPTDSTRPPAYSKYMTVWSRLPDGSVRYLTDGGNPRPRP